jgi:hypothetical protein
MTLWIICVPERIDWHTAKTIRAKTLISLVRDPAKNIVLSRAPSHLNVNSSGVGGPRTEGIEVERECQNRAAGEHTNIRGLCAA